VTRGSQKSPGVQTNTNILGGKKKKKIKFKSDRARESSTSKGRGKRVGKKQKRSYEIKKTYLLQLRRGGEVKKKLQGA